MFGHTHKQYLTRKKDTLEVQAKSCDELLTRVPFPESCGKQYTGQMLPGSRFSASSRSRTLEYRNVPTDAWPVSKFTWSSDC